ncbi:uncharacterized protein LOC118433653 isoform X2 [Folsomia candida]|nr:uncharacterized protein LOC118433653 isoform X2 [Folsomia candida]
MAICKCSNHFHQEEKYFRQRKHSHLNLVMLSIVGFVMLFLPNGGQCHHTTLSSGDNGVAGESRPPILSHVRVSRGPDDGSSGDFASGDYDDDSSPSSRPKSPLTSLYPIKSPSYQHKMNHISQFHSTPHYSSDVTFSLRPLSHAVYPVAAMHGRMGRPSHQMQTIIPSLESENGGHYLAAADDPQTPTFTPYIGSRILSNIPKFFEHLHENIKAIHDSSEGDDSSSSVSVENVFSDSAEHSHMDMPSRRGDYFQSDGRLSVDSRGYRYDTDDENPQETRGGGGGGQFGSDDMLAFMGRDPKYKKANNYNPAWLFTNLGLGKRSVHFHQKSRNTNTRQNGTSPVSFE